MMADGPHRVFYHLLRTVQVPDHNLKKGLNVNVTGYGSFSLVLGERGAEM